MANTKHIEELADQILGAIQPYVVAVAESCIANREGGFVPESADMAIYNARRIAQCAIADAITAAIAKAKGGAAPNPRRRAPADGVEPDYGGVLGADGQVHSDADPGL